MLTRLRQLCLHESLVPDSFIESLGVPLEGEGKQLGMVSFELDVVKSPGVNERS